MAGQPLGYKPATRPLIISRGGDFAHIIDAPAGNTFPAGTTAKIVIYDSDADTAAVLDTWDATATITTLEWREEAETVAAIPGEKPYQLYVSFPGVPRLDLCWCRGTVVREQ